MTEYRVTMQDGSIYTWSHHDEKSALDEMRSKSYKPVRIQPWSEWAAAERELEVQDKQREWNWKAERDIEGERTA